MKLEGGVFEARSLAELHEGVIQVSEEGWRVITVLDRSTPTHDRFVIVVQRDAQ